MLKFLRVLLGLLAVVIAVAAVLLAAAFAPPVQTWFAERMLATQPGLTATLGSLSAGFHGVEASDLQLVYKGAVLTIPSVQARVPLATNAWHRKAVITSLVARDWILDLSGTAEGMGTGMQPAPARASGGAPGSAAPASAVRRRDAEGIVRAILGGLALPFDGSLDGVDLEGDLLLAAPSGTDPIRVHVLVKGGGLSAGHEGVFAVEAACDDSGLPVNEIALHGQLFVAMEYPLVPSRIGIKADVSAKGGQFPEGVAVSLDASAARGSGGETCTLDLKRDGRHLTTILAHLQDTPRRLAGNWKVDLRDTDLAPLTPAHPLPSVAATGEGRFDADPSFSRLHVEGRVSSVASGLGVLAPPLDRLGQVALETRFELVRSGRSIRVEHLDVSMAGKAPSVVVRSLQPFEFDERTADLKVANPAGDWMKCSIERLPLSRLSALIPGIAFTRGDATGEFALRAAGDAITLRPATPLIATGVTVQRAGATLGRGLDLSLSLLADYSPKGWEVRWAPITVGSSGRRLATIEGNASHPSGADQPIAIAGTWNFDLEALASLPANPGVRWIPGHSATGGYSASLGSSTEVEASLAVIGRDPSRSVTASVHTDLQSDGAVAFIAPIRIATGSGVSELSAEGTWIGAEEGPRFEVKLTGESIALEHLRLLGAPLAALGGVAISGTFATGTGRPPAPAGIGDRIPFWGNWVGSASVAFERLRTGRGEFRKVGGTFEIDHGSLQLEGGRAGMPQHGLVTGDCSISFDAGGGRPYRLKATAAAGDVDVAPFFAAGPAAKEPPIEGRFSVTGTFEGSGANLADLFGHTRGEFRLTSTGGVLRLLKTNVADAIPQVDSPVSDAVGSVGSLVGKFIGLKGDSLGSGKNPVSKEAEAVLEFTNQVSEIGYDQMTLTAVRSPDHVIHLLEMTMTATDMRLTGSGEIAYVEGRPLRALPLSLNLEFGARGKLAELLATAGLISTHKDALGYAILSQAIHFGGTPEQVDESQWHDFLARAAARKPEAGKKGG